jgi:two-component system sensor histidine kinase UhpB
VPAIRNLCDRLTARTGVNIRAALPVSHRPLGQDVELVIYRVAQEALTNVARHALARRVELRLGHSGDRTVLTVRDDGRGLPPESLSSSNGIRGMRERAMLIGAQLSFATPPNGGTEVQLSIPPLEPGSP